MYHWVTLSHLVQWTSGTVHGNLTLNAPVNSICNDSRELKAGDVFIALKGPSFDAHAFIKDVEKSGALAAIVDRPIKTQLPLIQVKDTFQAMIQIAKDLRKAFTGKVIAVTGSAGKSSTKDMIATLLGPQAVKSPASFNNLVGVSRTLFLLNEDSRFLVLEMGMNALSEIKTLCETFHPHFGLITNIGEAHLGKLGGTDGVYRAKKEMFDFLASQGALTQGVVLNLDDIYVLRAYRDAFPMGFQKTTYSRVSTDADVYQRKSSINPKTGFLHYEMMIKGHEAHGELPLFGQYQMLNASAAVAAALLMGVEIDTLKSRLGNIRPARHRGEIYALSDDSLLIDESYNSNPVALKESLLSLTDLDRSRRRIIVLGDMRELGEFSKDKHCEIGRYLAERYSLQKIPFYLLTIGKDSTWISKTLLEMDAHALTHHVESIEEAVNTLQEIRKPSDILFVKSSRALELDRLVARLLSDTMPH